MSELGEEVAAARCGDRELRQAIDAAQGKTLTILFHYTSAASARSIAEEGFRGATEGDCIGHVWLSESREGVKQSPRFNGAFVVVELPKEVAERHRYYLSPGDPYLDNFCVPC